MTTAAAAEDCVMAPTGARHREQMRARYPDAEGFAERDGVRIFYEVYGSGEPTIVLVPTWHIVHSRIWKGQIPDLARHGRVIAFDPRGNGRSDRPTTDEAYGAREFAADILSVLDATGTDAAVLVTLSLGSQHALIVAAEHPDRVRGWVSFGPSLEFTADEPDRAMATFTEPQPTDDGWAKYNRHYWRRDFDAFLEFFFGRCFTEPHSTKHVEDSIGWGREIGPETLTAGRMSTWLGGSETRSLAARVRCPTLVIVGEDDAITGTAPAIALAAAVPGAELVMAGGGGHILNAREPVWSNLRIREFLHGIREPAPPTVEPPPRNAWTRSLARRRRALYVSSPIGLGHALRDGAIASELRRIRPDLDIDWLAQDPVTAVLEARGERIHPASRFLASESAHFASEATGHDLNAFQAIRRMDEILVANFMLFHHVVEQGDYDLVIGDEAWDVDHYLHENPELKRTAYAWMTDFVGWLPMPEGGEREAVLTADYNLEMIEHIDRYPQLRDQAIFVGDPDDIVPDAFGPGLPAIRAWTERHYNFAGYVTGFDPSPLVERREELRRELGFRPDERVVVVTVGGSGVGEALLRRVIESFPEAARLVPGLRMIAVTGPRIEPSSLAAPAGVEVVGFVNHLYRHLAACDLAVVQGGLTTTMELTAARRPFIYFPLANHFEQARHVRHRLERYGAGRAMDYATSTSSDIASAIGAELGREVDYLPVASDGAARAAELIAALI